MSPDVGGRETDPRSRARRRVRTGLRGAAALLIASALLLPLDASPASAQSGDSVRTTLDGVYTTEQAAEGRRIYTRVCASCHTLDWYQGDVVRAWEGGTLFGLFDIISTTMPEDNPGSLKTREYLDVLAYILELNGLPSGAEPLPVGRSRLNAIRFQFEGDTPSPRIDPKEDACRTPGPLSPSPHSPPPSR